MTDSSGDSRTYTITVASGFTGTSVGVAFADGVATLTVPSDARLDDPDARRLAYFAASDGYTVTEDVAKEEEPTPAPTRSRTRATAQKEGSA